LLGGIVSTAEAVVHSVAPRSDAAAQARGLRELSHRPWPLPDRPWLQGQTWSDLLFAHWPVAPEVLRPAVPAELPLDVFDGSCWIGITPFEVRGARGRGIPPVPRLSRFAETNVRTYTTVDGRPGIWFLSLDAASWAAVAGARRAYRLPYFRAHAGIERRGAEVRYTIDRIGQDAALSVSYLPVGPVSPAAAGSLEYFLTERYCLYTIDDEHAIHRADIHHPPWPLQQAEATFERNTIARPYGIELPDPAPLLHFAGRQDVVIWPLERVS
jgi:uncharacterized protein